MNNTVETKSESSEKSTGYSSGYIRNVGFTGTRKGMRTKQLRWLYSMLEMCLEDYPSDTDRLPAFHHGDCVGADCEAHAIAAAMGFFTHSHPPVVDNFRAFCKSDQIWKPLKYMDRNQNIVDACDILLAAPNSQEESDPRSGTWATIRRARAADKKVVILR